jgi:hypothetical protein
VINALILRFLNRSYLRFNSQLCKKLSLRLNIQSTTSTVSKIESDNTFPLSTRLSIPCMRCPCLYSSRSKNAMVRFRQWRTLSQFVQGSFSREEERYLFVRLYLRSSQNKFRNQQTLPYIAHSSMHPLIVAMKRASLKAPER